MTTTEVYRYRFLCSTENTNVYSWGTTDPTMCPNNHTHTINAETIVIVETIKQNTIRIVEEDVPTQGEYMYEVVSIDINTATGSESYTDMSYPYPISIGLGRVHTVANQANDCFYIEVPKFLAGILTADVSDTSLTMSVNSTVMGVIKFGYCIVVNDGVNETPEIRVDSINRTTNVLTLANPLGYSFVAGTYVYIKVYFCKAEKLGNGGMYETGSCFIGAKNILANIPLRFRYINVSGGEKYAQLHMEYMY